MTETYMFVALTCGYTWAERCPMAWEKSSTELVELFGRVLPASDGVERKQMFGYPCAFLNGNLCCGLFQQSMMLRLPTSDQAKFLKQKGTAEFQPMPGRPLKEYVAFNEPLSVGEDVLRDWLTRAMKFVSTLPAKTKTKVPTKKATAKRKSK